MKKSFCWLKSEITLHMADPQFRMPLFIDPNHYTYTHKLFSFVFKVKSDSRASAKCPPGRTGGDYKRRKKDAVRLVVEC